MSLCLLLSNERKWQIEQDHDDNNSNSNNNNNNNLSVGRKKEVEGGNIQSSRSIAGTKLKLSSRYLPHFIVYLQRGRNLVLCLVKRSSGTRNISTIASRLPATFTFFKWAKRDQEYKFVGQQAQGDYIGDLDWATTKASG